MSAPEQTRGIDVRIAELAARQHGVVARPQVERSGLGRRGIALRLKSGRLHRLHPGVYAVGHRAIPQEARWMAAVLFCGSGAVLSHRSAAELWGIRASRGSRIHVTSPSKSRSHGSIRRHYSVLPDDEMAEHDGIPVTSVPRTIFDLAAGEPPHVIEAALRQSEYLQLHDRLSLPHLLERYPGRRGAKAIRQCLARRREAPGHARGPLEEPFLPFLDRHRLPRPRLNAWIEVGGRRFQVDCLWVGQRLVAELDGFASHRLRSTFESDRSRDRAMQAAGYRTVRITWRQLEDEPGAIAADLRLLLAAS